MSKLCPFRKKIKTEKYERTLTTTDIKTLEEFADCPEETCMAFNSERKVCKLIENKMGTAVHTGTKQI